MLVDLEILIPEALADVLDFRRMGDADHAVESLPCVLIVSRGEMCLSIVGSCGGGGDPG